MYLSIAFLPRLLPAVSLIVILFVLTSILFVVFSFFFFFQAEDGIRDHCVTGVQTCALPIFNQAFCWTPDGGYRGAHAKYYLPDEPDGWEATWFAQGDRQFAPIAVGPLTVGFQLCTELLFTEPAREIGRSGAHLIAAPRATSGHRRWPMAACMAAVMSGCFVASANRRSYDSETFAGRSWLVSPEGEMLGETSADMPFLTVEIALEEATRAKSTYPRNLPVP